MDSTLASILNEQQLVLTILMFVTIPLSYILALMKNKYQIMFTSIILSIIIQCIMFPNQKYFLWIQQQIVYLLLRFGPRKNIGIIVLIETMTFLAAIHIRRMYIAYAVNGVEISCIIMMQTFLYVGLAYNYQNGLKVDGELSEDAQKRKVVQLPNYLTYIGYVFFLPACLVGPSFEFKDFQSYINRKDDYESIPNTLKPALTQLSTFLLSLIAYIATSQFSIQYCTTPQFANHTYLYKIYLICMIIFHIQFKYITAWSLCMISIHCSGISYDKSTNKFNKIQITKIYQFFCQSSFKIKIQSWNMSIQLALKRYLYDQYYNPKVSYPSDKIKKKVQQTAQRNTLLVSALWHGFYPGYFVSFFHWMMYLRILQELFRIRQNNKNIQLFWSKWKFGIIQNVTSNFVFMYFGIFFHLMTWENIKTVLASTYAIPFFILYAFYFVICQTSLLKKTSKSKINDVPVKALEKNPKINEKTSEKQSTQKKSQ